MLFHGLTGGSSPEKTFSTLAGRMSPHSANDLRNKLSRLNTLKEIADEKQVTTAQLAIAWVLAQGEDMIALVGSRTRDHFNNTLKAIDIKLSTGDLRRIEQIIPKAEASSSSMMNVDIDEKGLFKH